MTLGGLPPYPGLVSAIQLQVIPDEWTGLPAFVPGERDVLGDDVWTFTGRPGELVIPAARARELAAASADLKHLIWLGLIDHDGNPVPAVPAGQDAYGNSYYAATPPVAAGNSYQFASGGIVAQ